MVESSILTTIWTRLTLIDTLQTEIIHQITNAFASNAHMELVSCIRRAIVCSFVLQIELCVRIWFIFLCLHFPFHGIAPRAGLHTNQFK